MERKENDKREEGRKGERVTGRARLRKRRREGADCKEECILGDQKSEAKGANKNILHHLITK